MAINILQLHKRLVLLCAVAFASSATADISFYEAEPNNTPADFHPIAGEVTLLGSMLPGDQDGFLWTVSDVDARKRWTFELNGIAGALTLVQIFRLEYADNNIDVVAKDSLMKVASRDGLKPALAEDLLFEPGEYVIGIARGGGGSARESGAMFRPPAGGLSFGDSGQPESSAADAPATGAGIPATVEELGAYRFIIRHGSTLLVQPDAKPNTTKANARPIRAADEFANYQSSESMWYALEFLPNDFSQRWDLTIDVPVGRVSNATVYNHAGEQLISGRSNDRGRITFADLTPVADPYAIELELNEPGYIQAFSTRAVGQRVDDSEAEPNDSWKLANRFDSARPLSGRIGQKHEDDYFEFSVTDVDSDSLLQINATTEVGGSAMELCLLNAKGRRLQCRKGSTPLQLADLLLHPGRWGLLVSSTVEGTEYQIAVTVQGAVEPDTEVEPNDTIELASSVPPKNRIKGRFSGDDQDVFRFTVADEPQLWRFQVIGDGISEVMLYDGAGGQVQRIRPRSQQRVRFENVFLLPGKHYLRVAGRDGESYTVLARPLGPPDANAEREPNDDESSMQPLAVGQTRTGLLVEKSDTDYYRFFLANWDHIRLTMRPPADGGLDAQLYWQDAGFGRRRSAATGEAFELSGLFPPGDYHVALTPTAVSDAEYRLSLERLPRYGCPIDCEPSAFGKLHTASPLPRSRILQGHAGEWGDEDSYQLPVQSAPTELVIRSDSDVPLSLGRHKLDSTHLKYDKADGTYRAKLLPDTPYQVIVARKAGDYRLTVQLGGEPQPQPPASLPAQLRMRLDTTTVAAYRSNGQQVSGALNISNTGTEPLALVIDATTSDYRWQVIADNNAITVGAGAELVVPLLVEVPSDAWADRPVRISARVQDQAGSQLEAWQEITVDRQLMPVAPKLAWTVPESLLGGFNVAWEPLGARWVGSSHDGNGYYERLFNDIVYGNKMVCCGTAYGWKDGYRPELTIELPGAAPVPVAGLALNHFVPQGNPWKMIRQGALLLSDDGVTFREVLSFATEPVQTEQFFALDKPQMARFARLRINSTFDFRSGSSAVSLGEWKVIAEPGFDLSAGVGYNLADPDLGGHVVSDLPPSPNRLRNILHAEMEAVAISYLDRGETLEYVIGFHHNRAAQIDHIAWHYGAKTKPESRLRQVGVAISTESPVGPWITIGELTPNATDALASIDLDTPVWARFVRLTTVRPEDATVMFRPESIQITERPSSADYRSVLAEWGNASRPGDYERQRGLPPPPEVTVANNTSRARAALLKPGQVATGQAALAKEQRWYRLQMPSADNVLTFALTGDPTVRTVLSVETRDGAAIPLRRITRESSPVRHVLEAIVEPGSEVFIQVTEPPRNVMFTWDTSSSTGRYLRTIYNSLSAFASQVTPGQEAVNLLPFGEGAPLLKDWQGEPYILQTILNDYPRSQSSSSGEHALTYSTNALAPLAGSKAILVITDGQVVHHGPLWESMQRIQPRIFGVHVAGFYPQDQDVFQDWTSVNGGHYTYLYYNGEMDVAFDRATTLMRRPADFTLSASSSYRKAPGPGFLQVTAGKGAGGNAAGAVELILDASGSMWQRLDGRFRIDIAKEVLTSALNEKIPPGTQTALRVFGHRQPNTCDTELVIPLKPLDAKSATAVMAKLTPQSLAKTPIAASLAAVAKDLGKASGSAVVVLVTDGEETCDGDPAAEIEKLRKAGFALSLNIVGFAIDDDALSAQFEEWAEAGGGRYFAANDADGLSDAVSSALATPYKVYDANGEQIAEGLVGDEPMELQQGVYRVVVSGSPRKTFEDVEVMGGDAVSLELD